MSDGSVAQTQQELIAHDSAAIASTSLLPKILAWCFTGGICCGLAWAFRAYGGFTVALLLLYLAGLVATQLSVHWVVQILDFPYPSFLTLLQFIVLLVLIALFCDVRNFRIQDAYGRDVRLKSSRFITFYLQRIVPIGAAIALCTATNNESLKLISPGLNAIIASMTPVCTGLLSALCGSRYSSKAWTALLIATCGGFFTVQEGVREMEATLESVQSDAGKSLFGMVLAFASLLLRALKTVIIERALRPHRSDKPSRHSMEETRTPVPTPTQTLVLQTPMVVIVSFLCAAADPAGLQEPFFALGGLLDRPLLALGILVNVVAANILQIVGLIIIRMLGATSMQLAGKFNIFIVMALSAAYTGEHIPMDEWGGAVVILISANMFTSATQQPPPKAPDAMDIEMKGRLHV
mmetsp:Transcript_42064/g.94568  ORF Transcript_42064/g.94568 Transcript_42064/m.94568 type:complete len:408 (+) Transcript_42064:145-1368(+)